MDKEGYDLGHNGRNNGRFNEEKTCLATEEQREKKKGGTKEIGNPKSALRNAVVTTIATAK
mgnify:FL=1